MSDEESNLPVVSGESKAEIAYLMKMQGLSLLDIANELHCDPSAVVNMLKQRYKYEAQFLDDEERQGILAMENARLDYYLSKLWPQIQYGEVKAIAEARKITEVRLKANQLDQPAAGSTTNVLVVGGATEDYVAKLKELSDGAA